jgi:CBS domain-containing protein
MSTVEDYMNSRLIMRGSKASVLEIAKVMVDWNVSSVAIIDEKEQQQNNKQVIGILTERDIVRSIVKGVPLDGISAGSLTSSSPILSIGKDQPIEEAALIMIRNKVRHLLVEDVDTTIAHSGGEGRRIIGMITTTDLARYLKKKMKETAITIPKGDDGKELQRQEEEQQFQPQREYSSEMLLSEVWELYF